MKYKVREQMPIGANFSLFTDLTDGLIDVVAIYFTIATIASLTLTAYSCLHCERGSAFTTCAVVLFASCV